MTATNIPKGQEKYGKLPAKLSKKTLWNKIGVDLTGA